MNSCVFCKIVKKELPSTTVYEDEHVLAFKDINPVAPVHLLIIPKEHVDDFFNVEDVEVYLASIRSLKKLIKENGLMKKGYKVRVFGGGAQEVDHLHFHLIGPVSQMTRR